ncbi:DUF1543 domain-containing protein [Hyphomonas sp. WL0036]|uniref:DUF1543 domain-containing protein n=1 Tax=Hyphomonas sediminis TaxID=2866160 RepID=UPI001C805A56|nr:DUF1543 domain-containing protein [Hyphomonas sediminis]MBY9068361.1 DUF1543 domain-containing protein [Hyphomonas sediminis]
MKLYAVFVGGDHPRANIEVHDLRAVVGESLEATIPALRAGWWGNPSSLHIDGYAELTEVDGWQVEVVPGRPSAPPARRLWFVNLGGYTPGLFGEQHNYLFLAGADKAEVWSRARALSPEWTSRHKDNFVSIDEMIDVNGLLEAEGWHLRLDHPAPGTHPSRIVSDYIKL